MAVGLFVVAAIFVPNFYQPLNMLNLVTNNWAVISLGVGVTFLLVSGHFDLSVGGVVALSGVLAVWLTQSTGGANALAIRARPSLRGSRSSCALAGALAVGGLNALFVVRFRYPVDHRDAGHDDARAGHRAGRHRGCPAQHEPAGRLRCPR